MDADSGGGGSAAIAFRGVADVENFVGAEVQKLQRVAENRRIRFARAGVGRADLVLEKTRQPEVFENRVQAAVEIRNHGEPKSAGSGALQGVDHPRPDPPGGGVGIVIENGREPGVVERPLEGRRDQLPPPDALDAVAIRIGGEIRSRQPPERIAEAPVEIRGEIGRRLGKQQPRVGFPDRFGGIDQGAGGIE